MQQQGSRAMIPAPVASTPAQPARDFDVILGMDWLSPYRAILDCHAKMVNLAIPGLPRLEWKGTPDYSTNRVISYMKDRRMVEKGHLAYLAYIRHPSANVPSMDSVPVVHEFQEVFPADLPGMPPDRDIDFCIDLSSGTQLVSIPPYRMALPELKELKDQLQDLLDQGFIRPSVSPWRAPVLFVVSTQAGGGTQTSVARTPEQAVKELQIPWALPSQSVAAT
ncbi:uncharacterized protein [Nicotiana tomentosiformis]|uniref:uncharacterized protein n=1 Tax=Nicotiana tomentosiformis TaxID=4098 RepID=UPI00388C6B52